MEQEKTNTPPTTATGRIHTIIFSLLEQHPEGLRWTELLRKIEQADPNLHTKTINGCVWKITERYPHKVYKPSKGVFRLRKYISRNTPQAPQRND